MVGTITTTVRGGRSKGAGAVFLMANTAASGTIGFGLGMFGSHTPNRPILVASAVVSVTFVSAFVVHGRIPYVDWPPQLPSRWLKPWQPLRTAALYGLVWGSTFATPIRAGSLIVLGLLVIDWGDPLLGIVAFGAVGFLRAFPAALRSLRPPAEEMRAQPKLGGRWQRPLIGVLDAAMLTGVLAATTQTLITS